MGEFYIRPPSSKGDYEQIAACFAETRGSDYYTAEYYDALWLENSGNYEFLAAFDMSGKLASILAASRELFDPDATTLGLLTTRPEFAGQGVAKKLVAAFFERLSKRGVRAVKGQVVSWNTSTQRILDGMSFTPTGILCGIRSEKNAAIYGEGKGSLALYVKKMSAQNAGLLYVHKDIAAAARLIYDDLGASADIKNEGHRHTAPSETRRYHDAHNSTLYAEILKSGEDISEILSALNDNPAHPEILQHQNDSPLSLVILLNISDPSAVFGYEALIDAGFVFSGFDPLGEHEHAIFCKSNAKLSEIKATEKLQSFLDMLDII